jgi:RHS repeat-associated protein
VYAEGVNVPELMVTPTATYRFVKDHLGSVREVVDVATNAVVQSIEYDAWGRALVDTSPGFQPFGFAGGLVDVDIGLVRFGARDYDATTGRWTLKDPRRFGPDGSNLYAYARSAPTARRDPAGRDSGVEGAPATYGESDQNAAGAAAAAVAGTAAADAIWGWGSGAGASAGGAAAGGVSAGVVGLCFALVFVDDSPDDPDPDPDGRCAERANTAYYNCIRSATGGGIDYETAVDGCISVWSSVYRRCLYGY